MRICFSFLIISQLVIFANPCQMEVIQGAAAALVEIPGVLEIQALDKTILHWDSFSIQAGEVTRFSLPSADSAILNRVVGGNMSEIYGMLQSNGSVFLVNPQGVIVGKEGVIQTATFIASTLEISNHDFLAEEGIKFLGESDASIQNLGTILTPAGSTILLAHEVKNKGTIKAINASLGSGHEFYLQKEGITDLLIRPDIRCKGVENTGKIEAMMIQLQSDGATSFAIRQAGVCEAHCVEERGGKIYLRAEGSLYLEKEGVVQARGGEIEIQAAAVYDDGVLKAEGRGGRVVISSDSSFSATQGAKILAGEELSLSSKKILFSSGEFSCSEEGACMKLGGEKIALYAAKISATADASEIFIGEAFADCLASQDVIVNPTTLISLPGEGSELLLWSAGKMDFCGRVDAPRAFVEISGEELLHVGKIVARELLIDPATITIETPTGNNSDYPQMQFVSPLTGTEFGEAVLVLHNSNVVITQPDAGVIPSSGAVFLFNGSTGALINYVTGSNTNDRVGSGGITAVGSSNSYVISSPNWDNGLGAATFVNGTTGLSGTVSSTNSLVGVTAGDSVSSGGVTLLTNQNYVVVSPDWNGNAGAVTWGSSGSGVSGSVTMNNSIIGGAAGDKVGSGGVFALNDGNYVISSPLWKNGGVAVGAATWANGSVAPVPNTLVTTTNSIYGSTAGDAISSGGITALQSSNDSNFVVSSPSWHFLGNMLGAATWSNGSVTGAVAMSNSITGNIGSNDEVSSAGITALAIGDYVVASPLFNGGVGAATYASGSSATTATVSAVNSLTGNSATDHVASGGVTALTSNNYIVSSPDWANGAAALAGAATFLTGTVAPNTHPTTGNSLYGTSAADQVSSGGVVFLSSGAYTVISPDWNGNIGAVTFGPVDTALIEAVSTSNSLTGSTAGDKVGSGGVKGLSDSSYIVGSPLWTNGGTTTNAGAVTWVSSLGVPKNAGSAGAAVSTTNSLYGPVGAEIGGILTAASDGSYLVGGSNTSAYAAYGASGGSVGLISGTTALSGQSATLVDLLSLPSEGYFIAAYPTDGTGTVRAGAISATNVSSSLLSSLDMTVSPAFIEANINAGTNVTLAATGDITIQNSISLTTATTTSLNLSAGGDLNITNGITLSSVATTFNFTASNNLTLSGAPTLTTSGSGSINLVAGNNLSSTTGAPTIQTTGSGNINLVADNSVSSPAVGTGIISLDTTSLITTNTGYLRLYTSSPQLANIFPTTLNGVATPGINVSLGVYYPNGTGGFPFTIFFQFGTPAVSIQTAITNSNTSTASVLIASNSVTTMENDTATPANLAKAVLSVEGVPTQSTAPCQG